MVVTLMQQFFRNILEKFNNSDIRMKMLHGDLLQSLPLIELNMTKQKNDCWQLNSGGESTPVSNRFSVSSGSLGVM